MHARLWVLLKCSPQAQAPQSSLSSHKPHACPHPRPTHPPTYALPPYPASPHPRSQAVALVQQETVITLGQQNVHRGAPACNNASYNPAVPATTTVACPAPNLLGRVGAPYNTTTFP